MEGLKKHDVDGIAAIVSDDLAFVTHTKTLSQEQFLQMLQALYAGFPDWHYDHDPPELREKTKVELRRTDARFVDVLPKTKAASENE